MHHRQNQDVISLDCVEDSVREKRVYGSGARRLRLSSTESAPREFLQGSPPRYQ